MLCEVQKFRNFVMIMTGKCEGISCHIPEEQSPQQHPHVILMPFVLVPV